MDVDVDVTLFRSLLFLVVGARAKMFWKLYLYATRLYTIENRYTLNWDTIRRAALQLHEVVEDAQSPLLRSLNSCGSSPIFVENDIVYVKKGTRIYTL